MMEVTYKSGDDSVATYYARDEAHAARVVYETIGGEFKGGDTICAAHLAPSTALIKLEHLALSGEARAAKKGDAALTLIVTKFLDALDAVLEGADAEDFEVFADAAKPDALFAEGLRRARVALGLDFDFHTFTASRSSRPNTAEDIEQGGISETTRTIHEYTPCGTIEEYVSGLGVTRYSLAIGAEHHWSSDERADLERLLWAHAARDGAELDETSAKQTVSSYFCSRLNVSAKRVHELLDDVQECPLETPCGEDCRKAIDAAAAFIATCDPTVHADIIACAVDAVAVYING